MTRSLPQTWRENSPLLAVPLSAAVVGYLIGRLLRGRDG